MVQAAQLALRVVVRGGGGLRLDNSSELVGDGVPSGSMGEVDESAGRDAITARCCTPEDQRQTLVKKKANTLLWSEKRALYLV